MIFFFFNDTATTEIYTLSLHDALPICGGVAGGASGARAGPADRGARRDAARIAHRSEEHTSELQSQSNLVCRLLLEKKKKIEREQRMTSDVNLVSCALDQVESARVALQ